MFSPPIYDGLNINLHLHSVPLIRSLYVDSYFLVKLLFCRDKKHIRAFIAFVHEIFQRFARIRREIAVYGNTTAVIDVFLQDFTRDSGAEDEKITMYPVFGNSNAFRAGIEADIHKQFQSGLHIRNDRFIAFHYGAHPVISFDFYNFHTRDFQIIRQHEVKENHPERQTTVPDFFVEFRKKTLQF